MINLAKQARAAGLPIACATSGLRDVVELHMKHAGLTELFDAVVCVGDLPPGCGKPKPDVYLEAARQIGVSAPWHVDYIIGAVRSLICMLIWQTRDCVRWTQVCVVHTKTARPDSSRLWLPVCT